MMTWDELRAYCLAKPGAWEDEPWEGDLVVKVHETIFAALGRPPGQTGHATGGASVGVKAGLSREEADEWLLRFPSDASVMAYIGRSGWNSLRIGGGIPDDDLCEAVDVSYALVVSRLPRKHRPVGWDEEGAWQPRSR
jgi:predicted DNA-binding protein (MmcQ/YjbR family)